jgi:hypothetical protein
VSDVVVAGAVSAVGLGVVSNVGRLYSKGKAISKTEKTLSKLERSLYKSKSNKVKKRMQGKVDKYNDKLWKQNANFTSDLKGSIWVAGGTVIVKKANDLISEPCP